MDKNFKLTSREFAESIGITLECLYSRLRRGHYKDQYISKNNLLLFKRMRPFMDDKIINDNKFPVTRRLMPATSSSQRARRTKYPNYAFQQHNEIKMLARLKGKVSEEVINEIVPETIKLAQEKLYQDKQRRFYESVKPVRNYGSGIYNAKASTPKYKAIGEPIRRDDDTGSWVNDLPGKPKTYY
jgi:hypothetical protein